MSSVAPLSGTLSFIKLQNVKSQDIADVAAARPAPVPTDDVAAKAPRPVPAPLPTDPITQSIRSLFSQFDLDADSVVSRDEFKTMLEKLNVPSGMRDEITGRVFAADINNDGLTLADIDRFGKIQAGDRFAPFDLNNDNEVSERELEEAIDAYSRLGVKFDAEGARNLFAAKSGGDGVLTRAEFELTSVPPAPIERNTPPSIADLFKQIDANGDGISREELVSALKGQGLTDKQIAGFTDLLFKPGTDVDGNGKIDLTEYNRGQEILKGNRFALGDLDLDGKITRDEINRAVSMYKDLGVDVESALKKFDAKAGDDDVLTLAEFNAPDKVGKKPRPISPDEVIKQLFTTFDVDGNGRVSRDELLGGLEKQGFSKDQSVALADAIFARGTDANGDGDLTLGEIARRQRIDSGDLFAAIDRDSDGKATLEEFEAEVALLDKLGIKLDVEGARKLFVNAAGNDGVLTREEFAAMSKGTSDKDVAAARPVPTPVAPAPIELVKIQLDSKAVNVNPALMDAQLAELLK